MFGKPATQRADTLSIKARLSEVLTPEDGAEYWRSLGELLTGKITREEWSDVVRPLLNEEAARLHNQLILAILYNTTKASVAPPATSRHAGWNKRRREGDDAHSQLALSLDPREAKRRRVKEIVYSLGKRERNRVKGLALLGQPTQKTDLLKRTFGPHDAHHATLASKGLAQELTRCMKAELCGERGALPSVEVLKDRMSCGAYSANLSAGVEGSAASLASLGLEIHLRRILTTAIDLARRSNTPAPSSSSADPSPSTVEAPLTLRLADISSLFELNPQTFISGYVGAIESALSSTSWPLVLPEGEDDMLAPPSAAAAANASVTPVPPPAMALPPPAATVNIPPNGIAAQKQHLPPAAQPKLNGSTSSAGVGTRSTVAYLPPKKQVNGVTGPTSNAAMR